MSWAVELNKVYDLACERGESVLPIFHTSANAHVEVTLTETGEFVSASLVDKENSYTVIPVTEKSGARTSGAAPHPLSDNLTYIAGDFDKYTGNDNEERYKLYLEQLGAWRSSDFSHPALDAVYTYVNKRCVMHDLVEAGVLQVGEDGKLNPKVKSGETVQEKFFVRFIVDYSDPSGEKRTWLDAELQSRFIEYSLNTNADANEQLCYATGEMAKVTYTHPIIMGTSQRLISANDESGYKYRGRFSTKTEAVSVGHIASQKMHNALKWLMSAQRCRIDTFNIVTWASELQEIPMIFSPYFRIDKDCEPFDTIFDYYNWLDARFDEYRRAMNPDSKVMVLAIDSCSPGRAPLTYYDEIPANEYLDNLCKWYKNSAWHSYNAKAEKKTFKAFTPYDYIRAAYGIEQKSGLSYEAKTLYSIAGMQIMNFLPCITRGKPIPEYLADKIYQNASNKDAYKEKYNERAVMNAMCSILRLQSKGEIQMDYNPQETDRSYLYGCLLALADKIELDTYSESDRGKVVTIARRYWTSFSRAPYQTWQVIEEMIRQYIDKHKFRNWVEIQMQDIMAKFSPGEFANNDKLSPMYLLGYHHYTGYLYSGNNNNDENNEED